MRHEDAQRKVHEAIKAFLRDGEIAINWVLTIDVAGPDDMRYLAHRSGGGVDGTDNPMAWAALGMHETAADLARMQLDQMIETAEDEDDEEP